MKPGLLIIVCFFLSVITRWFLQRTSSSWRSTISIVLFAEPMIAAGPMIAVSNCFMRIRKVRLYFWIDFFLLLQIAIIYSHHGGPSASIYQTNSQQYYHEDFIVEPSLHGTNSHITGRWPLGAVHRRSPSSQIRIIAFQTWLECIIEFQMLPGCQTADKVC